MDDDDETLCKYGTPLKPYAEDEIPSKRPMTVEDQIVRDANGKRRFHGAFTGGFSAGYWNTVGSEEGWKPQQFKSSRAEKGQLRSQAATDFMDDEDLGEFGIAPQKIQTQEDFGEVRKRTHDGFRKGPIPGMPVLQTLLAPSHDKAAVRILKSMGWKDGQGVGARLTKKEKKKATERNEKELYLMKVYGCDMGPIQSKAESSDESDLSDYEITFAPDDFDPFVITPKDNTFGVGYSGLNKDPILKQNFRVFDTLEVLDRKSNKKLSIRGQAFGVGALEEDDDDIYERDDMTKYDFSLEDPKKKPLLAIKAPLDANIIEGFQKSKVARKPFQKQFKIDLPENFKPRDWSVKRSRFQPLAPEVAKKLLEEEKHKKLGLGRHDLNPEQRGELLNEPSTSKRNPVIEKKSDVISGSVSNETSVTVIKKVQDSAKEITKNLIKNDGIFRPFAIDPDKQERYEKFLEFRETSDAKIDEFLTSIQPLSMKEWDKEREKKEFVHAKKLYRPLTGLMSDRFVSAGANSHAVHKIIEEKPVELEKKEIKMKREKVLWKPHKDLCKRFNVPEPFGGMLIEEKPKKKTKFSVFDYIEVPTNSRTNFVAPVMLPKVKKEQPKITAKEFFNEKVELPKPPPTGTTSNNLLPVVIPKIAPDSNNKEPKTELELKVEECRAKPPQEKKDLFKSIFCDSSDDEEAVTTQAVTKTEQEKLKLVESFVATKPASEFNVLRNKSPPRGIFKNVFEVAKSLPTTSRKSSSSSSDSDNEPDYYGPKLPSNIKAVATQKSCDLDEKLERLLKQTKSTKVVEKWVEKDKSEKKKKKKKEKHKHKHKKKKDKRK